MTFTLPGSTETFSQPSYFGEVFVDSGTTVVQLTLDSYTSLHQLVHSSSLGCNPFFTVSQDGGLLCPSTDICTNADFSVNFVIGSFQLTLNPSPCSDAGALVLPLVPGSDDSLTILGASLLSSYYAVYDFDNLRLGFAPIQFGYECNQFPCANCSASAYCSQNNMCGGCGNGGGRSSSTSVYSSTLSITMVLIMAAFIRQLTPS